jgi:glycerol-3-phosphate dehydrogenase
MLIVRTVFQAGYFCLVMFEGCKDMEYGPLLKEMFQANYFRIVVIEDETTVEVCGALKVSTCCRVNIIEEYRKKRNM